MRADHLRVLTLMSNGAWYTRAKLAKKLDAHFQIVAKSVGYRDAEQRYAFERTAGGGGRPDRPNPSLLTLEYVVETTLDVDGLKEDAVRITEKGRLALEAEQKRIANEKTLSTLFG